MNVLVFGSNEQGFHGAGAAGLDWSRRLGNDGGGLPYTVAFSAAGAVLWRHVGEISEVELRRRTVFSTTPPK